MPRRRNRDRLFFEPLERRLLLTADLPTSGAESLLDSSLDSAQFWLAAQSSMDVDASASSASRLSGTVGWFDVTDTYRIQLARETDVVLDLGNMRADADLYLADARGRRIDQSTKAGAQTEQIEATLASGSYYVTVRSYNGRWTPYQLSIGVAHRDENPAVPTAPPPASSRPTTPTTPTTTAPSAPTTPHTPSAPTAPANTLPEVAYYGGASDWNLNVIGAPEAWAAGYTGAGVTVAVIDTGIDRDHSELVDAVWRNDGEIAGDQLDNDGNGFVDDVFGWNFADNNNNTLDINGHGTHVAGSIAAARDGRGTTGVAYDARIMPVRVLSDDGRGTSWSVAAGIEYAVDNGANIINLSLGGSFSATIDAAMEYAADHGVLVIVAAGNQGAANPSHPATASRGTTAISVGAHNAQGELASFSNRVGRSGAAQVDAPGVAIVSTAPRNRFATFSGTSMAAPHVAGVAALAISANPSLTAAATKDLLLRGASRPISSSDSQGGINAAITVGYAASYLAPRISQTASHATQPLVAQRPARLASALSMTAPWSINELTDDVALGLPQRAAPLRAADATRFTNTSDTTAADIEHRPVPLAGDWAVAPAPSAPPPNRSQPANVVHDQIWQSLDLASELLTLQITGPWQQ